jgi:N-sulfoglucosamine sulfohydrolase
MNILLLICHDLGRRLNCYGAAGVPSLTLDWIAERGVRFANYYAASTPCSPSRGAIITGQYAHTNGLVGLTHRGFALNPDQRTVVHDFNDGGYDTHLFGFQHETDWNAPERLGYRHVWRESTVADRVAEQVALFLRSPAAHSRPFFLVAGFSEVHLPFRHPRYVPDRPEEVFVPPWLPDTLHNRRELARFAGAIRFMDQAVGQILTALDASPVADDTLLVFTTDHGAALPWAKSTLYDAGLGTALLMMGAGAAAGQVRDALLSNVDLAPTLLDAAGLPVPERMQGRSFLPLLSGRGDYEPRDAVFAERNFHDHYDPVRCVRTARYKYIRSFERRPLLLLSTDVKQSEPGRHLPPEVFRERPLEELYDLECDPIERVNLVADPRVAAVKTDLAARLRRWMEETDDPLLRGPLPIPPTARLDPLPSL